jgi:CheY-like chemotaxis protein
MSTPVPYSPNVEPLFRSSNEPGSFFARDIGRIPRIEGADTFHLLESIRDGWDWRLSGAAREDRAKEEHHRILLVNGDPLLVKETGVVLGSAGYQVRSAKNAEEALTVMRAEEHDLVVLDIMVDSILDGVYVSQTTCEDDRLRQTPVVMVFSIASAKCASHFPMDRYLHAVDFPTNPFSHQICWNPSNGFEGSQRVQSPWTYSSCANGRPPSTRP